MATLNQTKIRNPKELGKIIRNRRKELGFTQEFFARQVPCSPRFLGEVENGKAGANIATVIKIIMLLGMDMYIEPRDSKLGC